MKLSRAVRPTKGRTSRTPSLDAIGENTIQLSFLPEGKTGHGCRSTNEFSTFLCQVMITKPSRVVVEIPRVESEPYFRGTLKSGT
jgi:hypothetical protein